MVKIAVLVSGGGTNLQALIDAQKAGKIPGGEIALVVSSSPKAYALTRAEENGIPHEVVSRKEFPGEAFDERLLKLMEANGIQLVILAGFLCILGPKFVSRFPERILNVHPSLIPSFCGDGFYGLKVHEAALACGVKVTGATVHFVNEVTDGGRILLQKAVDVLEGDTPETLQRRVMEQAEWELLPRAAAMVCEKIQREEQERATAPQGQKEC